MQYHWVPPPQGSLKINVHGSASTTTLPNGKDTGLAAIFCDSVGNLRLLTIGVIPNLTPLGNQLCAIFIALKRAFMEGYRDVIVETDNLQAYRLIRNFNVGAPAPVFDIISHIDIRIRDPRWFCMLSFVFPARNRVARYAARLAMEVGDRLYTLDRPVAGIEELLDWDVGMRPDHPDYVDVVLPNNAPDPVDFNSALVLSDQLDNLGLGQVDAPGVVVLDIEVGENQDDMDGVEEQHFQGGIAADEAILFAGDIPLVDVD